MLNRAQPFRVRHENVYNVLEYQRLSLFRACSGVLDAWRREMSLIMFCRASSRAPAFEKSGSQGMQAI